MRTDLVLDALKMALAQRGGGADVELIHHSDRGSPSTSIDYGQTLDDHGVLASVGSVGDAYDNALAESFVDSFKTELIADRVWRTRSQLELALVEYLGWFNNARPPTPTRCTRNADRTARARARHANPHHLALRRPHNQLRDLAVKRCETAPPHRNFTDAELRRSHRQTAITYRYAIRARNDAGVSPFSPTTRARRRAVVALALLVTPECQAVDRAGYADETSSADSSTNTEPPEFANPGGCNVAIPS
jgi:Integrase core domain